MTLDQVLTILGAADCIERLTPFWEESMASLSAPAPSFLLAEEVRWCREFGELPSESEPALLEAARRIRESPELLRLAWHCCRLMYERREYEAAQIRHWPELRAPLGDLAGTFYLLVALAAFPRMRAAHQARGVPEEVTRNGSHRVRETVAMFQEKFPGEWGVEPRTLPWLRNHTAGILYRLGRMEYMVKPFRGRLRAYRHVSTGHVVALSEEGVFYNAEGYVDAGVSAATQPGGWSARLVEDEDAVTGCPISPEGRALRQERRLPRAEWRQVLAVGDPVLEMHIPEGGGMMLERCGASMQWALEFFPRHFPELPFVGFACASWILDPTMAEWYSPTSNMVRWMHELYLYPYPSSGRGGIYFVFGEEDIDPKTAPRNTSLRRAMADQLAAGRPLRHGGMFLLEEDFVHFGTRHYRRQW